MSEDSSDHHRSSNLESSSLSVATNVQVAVRCRPLNSREKVTGRGAVVQCKPNSNEVAVVKRKTYTFDRVFGQYSTQKEVFTSIVRPVVDEALAGYNCTVFAYGQTGTGKTYTMQGDLSPGSEMAGIIPRSVRYIFDTLETRGEEFSVRVSFLQLYNEELKDLLDPDTEKKLRLMEDTKKSGIYCMNLLEVTATTAKHVYELVNTGVKNRITSETLMNENSSRSHSIFTIRIHSKEHNAAGEDLLRVGQLNLVDLAGSECVGRSGARNARAREAGTINQSLLTLGRVITALVDNLPHVPYRDSKLTRLLQESLGGRAKTTIIATLAPCADSLDESLSTLEYAFRAKNIKNKPELNQKMTKAGLLNDFGSEIESLRAALRAARLKDGVYLPLEQLNDMQERLTGQSSQLLELEETLKARNTICKELEEIAEKHANEVANLTFAKDEALNKLAAVEDEIKLTKEKLGEKVRELHQVHATLKAFQNNEEALLANGATATTLYSASEKCAAQLLSKIENSQSAEEANTALATSFCTDSLSQINKFLKRLAQHKESQEVAYHEVSKALQEMHNTHFIGLDGFSANVDAQHGLVEAHRSQYTDAITEDEIQKHAQRDELTGSINKLDVSMNQQLQKFVTTLKIQTTAIIEDLASSKLQNESFLGNVQSILEKSREEMGLFLTIRRDNLLQHQNAINLSIKKQSQLLNENKAALTAALKESHDQQHEGLDELKAHLALCIDKCIQDHAQNLNEQTQLIEETVEKQHRQLLNIQTATGQEVKNFVQAVDAQMNERKIRSAKLQEQFSSFQDHLGQTKVRQSELVQSHEQLHIAWSDDIAARAKSHTKDVSLLLAKHSETDATSTSTRRKQMSQFFSGHEKLWHKLQGGCTIVKKGLEVNLTNVNAKLESASVLATKIIGEATDASAKEVQAIEMYTKKRKVVARTGTTPTKINNRPFPTFEATKISFVESSNVEDAISLDALSSGRMNVGHKRRRSKDATSSSHPIESTMPAELSCYALDQTVRGDNKNATSSKKSLPTQDSMSSATNAYLGIQANHKPDGTDKEVNTTPSKLKKTGLSLQHSKKHVITQPHRNIKIPSGGARQTKKTSALAAPKRYRLKPPADETTN
ncbi:hypothetical protein CCR75_005573 [Bremia lactucae]|uniref:Kinesin motor domain-containing protein n=1 Tax=Bremia lactucae TaxID=4779 RepID=A0A976FEN7_BRELC|nr:hypothetical protein CCR75_005573 [Bremia lactucae]